MKAEQYNLISSEVRANLISRICELSVDGKIKVIISDAGSKSVKQRGLQWKWYTEVSMAGIGGKHEESKDGVHLVSKYRWAVPILIRDDELFADLYSAWKEKHGADEEAMRWFIDIQISTEKFNTTQMAEYLTDFEKHYRPLVALTDPKEMGL